MTILNKYIYIYIYIYIFNIVIINTRSEVRNKTIFIKYLGLIVSYQMYFTYCLI